MIAPLTEKDFIVKENDDGSYSYSIDVLQFSDNSINFYYFKSLISDGVSLDVEFHISKRQTLYFTIQIEGYLNEQRASISMWLIKEIEEYLFKYLLTGENDNIPPYPPSNHIVGRRVTKDYLLRHVKREYERNQVIFEECTISEEKCVKIKAEYPYGSICYGEFHYSKKDLIKLLDNIKSYDIDITELDIPELHNSDLEVEYKSIDEGKYLSSIFRNIPSNVIINKTLCGIGATWSEIHAKRHSIIIEPNVPVIIGKEQQHKHIIGIYGEGLKTKQVKSRIKKKLDRNKYVKLMTTPDSYPKAISALKKLGVNYKKNFFMLFDECEKTITDIDYRSKLILPIDDFFDFDNKAMVSATPIIIDDPRFKEQEFKVIKLEPTFDHKRRLQLTPTNNVQISVIRALEEFDNEDINCVFFNSVQGIKEIIDLIEHDQDNYNIYCSTEAVKNLKREGYSNSFDNLLDEMGEINLKRYNFFTSRFFSAVDIELDYKPNVIIVSQVFKRIPKQTPFSLIDPEVEAIQIAGRFRNGLERLIHITNFDDQLEFKDRDELEQFLTEQHTGYLNMEELLNSSDTEGERYIIEQGLKNNDFVQMGFVTSNGKKNYFRYNNSYIDERLKFLYRYPAVLHKVYNETEAFKVESESVYSICTDRERSLLKSSNTPKAERIELIHELITRSISHKDSQSKRILKDVEKEFPLYFEALKVLGLKDVKRLQFKDSAVRSALVKKKEHLKYTSKEVFDDVYSKLQENTWYATVDINNALWSVFDKHGLEKDGRGDASKIANYFQANESRKSDERGWQLGPKKS